jgi:hypothetical protein
MKSVNKTESVQRKDQRKYEYIKSRLLLMKKMMNEDGYPFSTISKKISIYL